MPRFRQEITVWDKAPNIPNHIYVTRSTNLIGFVPQGTKEVKYFSSPIKQWSVSRRKFRDLTAKETKELIL
jgi:hypothetical protein